MINQIRTLLLGFTIGCLSLGSTAFANARGPLPPIPPSLVSSVLDVGHPFLLMDRRERLEIRRRMFDPPLEDGAKLMRGRIEGYFDDDSPWYLGEGPFERESDFEPMRLSDERFYHYTEIVMDLCTAHTIDTQREWVQKLQIEAERILNTLEDPQWGAFHPARPDPRMVDLLTLTAYLYDTVYMRIDTVRRHEPLRRIRLLRDRLATAMMQQPMDDVTPELRARMGASLAATTLFSMTTHPSPGKQPDVRSASPYLADLYRAMQWLQSGIGGFSNDEGKLFVPLPDIHHTLVVSIPLLETLRRHGYPFAISSSTWSQLVQAIETQRIPASPTVIDLFTPDATTPWLPRVMELSPPLDEAYQESQSMGLIVRNALDTGSAPEPIPRPAQMSRPVEELRPEPPDIRSILNESIAWQRDGTTNYQRGDIYNQMLPRLEVGSPTDEVVVPTQDASWSLETPLPVPRVWPVLYRLADQYSPSTTWSQEWEDIDETPPSHPYYLMLYRPMRKRVPSEADFRSIIEYDTRASSLAVAQSRRERVSLSTVAAADRVVTPSVSIDVTSFLMGHEGTRWRWFHEVMHEPGTASFQVPETTPVVSSLYSVWEPVSTHGRTLAIRRHPFGMNGIFAVVAHFPDETGPHVSYVNIQKNEELNLVQDPNVTDWIQLRTETGTATGQRASRRESTRARFNLNRTTETSRKLANLSMLFSPFSVREAFGGLESFGDFAEVRLQSPETPFFYIAHVDQPGFPMFDIKYPELELPGQRILDWSSGSDIIAIRQGDEIRTPMIESDADVVIVSRSEPLDLMFYLMVNGTRLRAKTNPFQREWTLLVDAKDRPLTVAWSNRHLITNRYPRPESVFHAPDVLGFESEEGMVNYGRKGRQAVVHSPSRSR